MENLDIRNFRSVSSANDDDNILMSLAGGTAGKMTVGLFKTVFGKGISPVIKNGYWWIGDLNTNVPAEGKTPEFRKTVTGIEFKYITDPDTTWRLLVDIADIKLHFDDLTEEEKRFLIPHLDDFTPEEIAELQQPAADMIEKLKQTDKEVQDNEDIRKAAEEERVKLENERKIKDTDRNLAEWNREQAEMSREERFKTVIGNASQATKDAKDQADRAKEYADNPPKIGDNGNWWLWDDGIKAYVDTGTFAQGDIMFASFDIDPKTGSLICITPEKYEGPTFELNGGELFVHINEDE